MLILELTLKFLPEIGFSIKKKVDGMGIETIILKKDIILEN
jgi:hypothetical protein